MEALEYDRVFKDIPLDYTVDQLRVFIKAVKAERKRLAKQVEDYKSGLVPAYISNQGKWYNGLCKRIHAVDTVKFKAIRLYREKRDAQ